MNSMFIQLTNNDVFRASDVSALGQGFLKMAKQNGESVRICDLKPQGFEMFRLDSKP